jgi:hypothetical protein
VSGRGDFLGTFVAGEVSYFSRFTVKFVEIVAAGMATAISGYLIAHVSGFMSSPAPAPVMGAPGASAVSAQPSPPAQVTQPSQPVQVTQPSQPVSPAPPVAAEAGEPRSPSAQETTPPAKAPVRTTVKIKSREPAEKAREPAEKPRDAAETKPREPAEKPREAAESKPRDWESVEARVRAALANAAANRPPGSEAPPAQADTIQSPPAVAVQPPPGDEPSTTGTVAAPRVANPLPPQAAAVPEAPAKPDPLPAVEIKSRPVADVETVPPPAPAAPAEASNQSETPDLVSAIKKLPEILRNDKPVPAAEAPRPPMPVGQ